MKFIKNKKIYDTATAQKSFVYDLDGKEYIVYRTDKDRYFEVSADEKDWGILEHYRGGFKKEDDRLIYDIASSQNIFNYCTNDSVFAVYKTANSRFFREGPDRFRDLTGYEAVELYEIHGQRKNLESVIFHLSQYLEIAQIL